MKEGEKMLIPMRDKNNNLVSKDILDIDFDMEIEKQRDDTYRLWLNKNYYSVETYSTIESAEKELLTIIDARNQAEAELKMF